MNAPAARIDRVRIDADGRFPVMSTGIYLGDVARLNSRHEEP